ncbi:tetratricopeptide repeat protein [Sphingomonas ginkgonis]|uniref:tetratricopeptide repeat protein n=1 Tax=Sphingomonas ginkgonis TaxID=2315330 RepID=UPI00163B11A3|nr:tetratricopeptide repeat protein [Sphingomonas ginkgonis]
MAIAPESDDSFIREVDENLRRDRTEQFFRRHGGAIGAGVVVFLVAVGAFLWWQNHRREQAAEQSVQLSQVMNDIGAANLRTVPQRLDGLSGSSSDGIRAAALLTRADVALQQNDRPAAVAAFRKVMDDGGLPQPYRDVATIRLTQAEFDSMAPDAVISRLQPLAQSGNPWFGSAGELTALALIKANRRNEAARLLTEVGADQTVPATIRDRAQALGASLGTPAAAAAAPALAR